MLDAIESYIETLGGAKRTSTRRLATVLFTDIVGSTQRSAELGDLAWKQPLEDHHRILRTALEHHGGREISTAGDGFFATFDGPAAAARWRSRRRTTSAPSISRSAPASIRARSRRSTGRSVASA
jgi:class 3 adenylate cyclase